LTINITLAHKRTKKYFLKQQRRGGVVVMRYLCLISLVLCLFLCGPSCKRGQEEPTAKEAEKVEAPAVEEGKELVEEAVKEAAEETEKAVEEAKEAVKEAEE
jgi:hypothetical protein